MCDDEEIYEKDFFDPDLDIKEEHDDEDEVVSSEDEPLVYHIDKKRKKNEPSDDPFKDVIEIKDEPLDNIENHENNAFFRDRALPIAPKIELDIKLNVDNVKKDLTNNDINFGNKIDDFDLDDNNGFDQDNGYDVEDDIALEKKHKTKKLKKKKLKKLKKGLKLKKKAKLKIKTKKIDPEFENTCAICLIDFDSKTELGDHNREHHTRADDSQPVTCPFCEKCYNTPLGLKSHVRRKHRSQTFQCETCNKDFETKADYEIHVEESHTVKCEDKAEGEHGYFCDDCHLLFLTAERLKIHQIRKHNFKDKSYTYKCKHCNMTYDNLASLGVHERRKHKSHVEPLECCFCTDEFLNEAEYQQHMTSAHQGGEILCSKDARCEMCFIVFNCKSRLRNHMIVRHNKTIDPLRYQCPKCNSSYDKILSLNSHMERKHKSDGEPAKEAESSATIIVCNMCSMMFTTENRLKIHMQKKHNMCDESFKFACTKCDVRFTNVIALNRHVWKKHGPESLQCKQCDQQFTSKEEYDNHSHPTESYACTICKKEYHRYGTLYTHMIKEHKTYESADKVYFCHICNEAFTSTRQCNYHIQKEHSKLALKCGMCDHVASSNGALRGHVMRLHQLGTQTLSSCMFCFQFTGNSTEMCDHIWQEHDVKHSENEMKRTLPCPKCEERFLDLSKLKVHFTRTHCKDEDCLEPSTICQLCGEVLPQSKFKRHMDGHNKPTVKSEMKPRKCEFCDYIANNRTDLTFHMLRHASKDTLQCDVDGCTFKTNYKSSLDSHKVIKHKARELLQCSKCAYQSSNKYLMKYHEDEHLTGKKKYNCDKCSYSTHLPASISQHKFKHMEEKTFKCDQCSFATKYNTSLRQHIVKKHSDLVID